MTVVNNKFLPASLFDIISSINELSSSLINLQETSALSNLDDLRNQINDLIDLRDNISEAISELRSSVLELQNSDISQDVSELYNQVNNIQSIVDEFFGA